MRVAWVESLSLTPPGPTPKFIHFERQQLPLLKCCFSIAIASETSPELPGPFWSWTAEKYWKIGKPLGKIGKPWENIGNIGKPKVFLYFS